MGAENTWIIRTYNEEQENALKAFVKALKMKFEIQTKTEERIPLWQQEEVAKSIEEIDKGTAVLENWDVTRTRLFNKHNISE